MKLSKYIELINSINKLKKYVIKYQKNYNLV